MRPSLLTGALAIAAVLAPSHVHAQDAADARLKALMNKKVSKAKKKPAPAPASAQLSSSKDEDAEARPALFSDAHLRQDADTALLRALIFAFEPAPREIRVLAIEDLGLLADPRALNPLAHLVLDPDPVLALTAVKTVGHLQHPRAEEILTNVIRHPTLAPSLKIAAVNALPLQATASARELLAAAAKSRSAPTELKEAARTAVAGMSPPPLTPR